MIANLLAATSALAWLIVAVAILALVAIALTNGLVGLLVWIDTSTDVDEQTAAEWDAWVEAALLISETPIDPDREAEKLRAELECDAAVVLWLRGAS